MWLLLFNPSLLFNSANNGKKTIVDAEVKRIVKIKRSASTDEDRDLFDHLFRRSDSHEQARISSMTSKQKADFGWLDAITEIMAENDREQNR